MIAKPKKTRFGTPKTIFQVTTKGNIPIVQNTVNRINEICKEVDYKKYEVWVVSDVEERFEDCRVITVPVDYSCKAVYKARALQYAVEVRKKEKKNDQDTYIFHLDDESLIAKQTLSSILTYLEQTPAPISEGPIIYPISGNEKIRITNIADTLRPFCCFECVQAMSSGNPPYIHGSNLLVRSDIEEQVGWDNGKTFAEDTLFALVAKEKFGSQAFGWHGGVVEEKSPFTVRDLIRQRKRWFYGFLQNLEYLPRRVKIKQILRASLWISGFTSGMVSILVFLLSSFFSLPQNILPGFNIILISMGLLWLGAYQIGAILNGKNLSLSKRILFHLLAVIYSPLTGLIECSTPILAVVSRPRTFEMVRK